MITLLKHTKHQVPSPEALRPRHYLTFMTLDQLLPSEPFDFLEKAEAELKCLSRGTRRDRWFL